MNLLLLEPDDVGPDGAVSISDHRARHLLRVLHVTPGQPVRVGIINGPCGEGLVRAVAAPRVDLQCVFQPHTPERPRVDLLLALPRPKVLQRLWAQIAAIGVGHIALTNAEKVERDYFDTHVLAPETYRPLLLEGLQQARDTRLPTISVHKRFRVLVEDGLDALSDAGLRLFADPGASQSIATAVPAAASQRVLLAIGPEGGWNVFERELLMARGFQRVGIGPRTLRSDTATIALLALVHDAIIRA